MPSISDLLIQAAIGTVPLGVAAFAYKSATDANRRNQETAQHAAERQSELERTKVDAEAYLRAKAFYEDALALLERQLGRVQSQSEKFAAQLVDEQNTSSALRSQMYALQAQLTALDTTVNLLRQRLAAAGLEPDARRPDSRRGKIT